MNARHLLWIPAGAAVGFTASFVFGDLLTLALDLYYMVYFTLVLTFLGLYVRWTGLDLRRWVSRRLVPGLVLGLLGGLVLMQGVLARPETAHLDGAALGGALAWRGVVYGAVDGLLLLAFPWVVVWRAFGAEEARWPTKIGAGTAALLAVLLITTTYHLGYRDFRGRKIVQPNLGSVIGAMPTLLVANPVASPISHVFLHVTAVLHAPRTDLFLPPHRDAPARNR